MFEAIETVENVWKWYASTGSVAICTKIVWMAIMAIPEYHLFFGIMFSKELVITKNPRHATKESWNPGS